MNDYTGFFFPVSNSFERTCKATIPSAEFGRSWRDLSRARPFLGPYYLLLKQSRACTFHTLQTGLPCMFVDKTRQWFLYRRICIKKELSPSSEGNASVLCTNMTPVKSANIWIRHFQISDIHLIFPKNFAEVSSSISLGMTVIPTRN